jgi:hypothetical protein
MLKNITPSIDEDTLKAGRDYAKKQKMSLNSLIRKLLKQNVTGASIQWLNECFELMDRARANTGGKSWSRADLHRV